MLDLKIFNYRTLAVLKRELREKLLSKSFLAMTFLIPVLMFGMLGLQTLLMTYGGDENSHFQVISDRQEILDRIKSEFSSDKSIQDSRYIIDYKVMDKESFDKHIKGETKTLLDGKITGIVFAGVNSLKDKKIEYYSKNPTNNVLFGKMKSPINKALVDLYFVDKKLNPDDLKFASGTVEFSGYRVSEKAGIEEEGYGNMILSFLFTFLLYMSLLFLGALMMRSVVEEKNNRIVELLLSSVNTNELMAGKILGTSITGLMQMIIWMSPVLILISSTVFVLPAELLLKISVSQLLYFFLNYFIGLLIFTGLFGMVGAIFDNDQDAQSGQWPVMMLIMIPFFIALSMQNNPDTILARVSSLFPFASIIVMPARMALIDVPNWELALSFVINILTMYLVILLAGKIYRVGILMTGKKPKWSEVVKWVKYKY